MGDQIQANHIFGVLGGPQAPPKIRAAGPAAALPQ